MKQIKIQVKKGEERLDEEYFSRRGCGETLPSRRIYWAPGCHMWVIGASRKLDKPDSSREIAQTRFDREWQVLQVGWIPPTEDCLNNIQTPVLRAQDTSLLEGASWNSQRPPPRPASGVNARTEGNGSGTRTIPPRLVSSFAVQRSSACSRSHEFE